MLPCDRHGARVARKHSRLSHSTLSYPTINPNSHVFATLAQATSGDTPAARDGHCAAYDAHAHRLVVFGGRGADRRRLNDVHHLDLATWAWKRVITDGVGGCSDAGQGLL